MNKKLQHSCHHHTDAFLFKSRVSACIQLGSTLLNGHPGVGFRAGYKGRHILALVSHLGAGVDVEAHVVVLQLWRKATQLPNKGNFSVNANCKQRYEYYIIFHFVQLFQKKNKGDVYSKRESIQMLSFGFSLSQYHNKGFDYQSFHAFS